MKLLPRLEAVTGEVRCGRHKTYGMGSNELCVKPANHEGLCLHKSFNFEMRMRTEGNSQPGDSWVWEEFMAGRWIYDGGPHKGPPHIFGIDWTKGEGPEWKP